MKNSCKNVFYHLGGSLNARVLAYCAKTGFSSSMGLFIGGEAQDLGKRGKVGTIILTGNAEWDRNWSTALESGGLRSSQHPPKIGQLEEAAQCRVAGRSLQGLAERDCLQTDQRC